MSEPQPEWRTLKGVQLIQNFDTTTTSNGKNLYMCKVKMVDEKAKGEHGVTEFFLDEYKLPSEDALIPKLEFKKVYDIGQLMFNTNYATSTKDHWLVFRNAKVTVVKDLNEDDLTSLDRGIDPEYLNGKEDEIKPLNDIRLDNIESSLENIQVTMDTMLRLFQQVIQTLKELKK